MDRLERALERARGFRREAVGVGEPASGDPTGSATAFVPQPDAADSLTRQATTDEAVLENNRIIARFSDDRRADIFRILRTKVQKMMARSGLRSIGVTSPNYGDGKTTVAANLAISLALDVKQSVCLVDLDLRDPSVHRVLDLEGENGLGEYLLHGVPLAECLVRPGFDRLVVLPHCKPIHNSSEILGAPKMAALARELKARYSDRAVIYDLPPILPTDDTIGFLHCLDAVILVLREGVTPVDDVRRSLHALGDTMLLGTVLNRSSWRDNGTIRVKKKRLKRTAQ